MALSEAVIDLYLIGAVLLGFRIALMTSLDWAFGPYRSFWGAFVLLVLAIALWPVTELVMFSERWRRR